MKKLSELKEFEFIYIIDEVNEGEPIVLPVYVKHIEKKSKFFSKLISYVLTIVLPNGEVGYIETDEYDYDKRKENGEKVYVEIFKDTNWSELNNTYNRMYLMGLEKEPLIQDLISIHNDNIAYIDKKFEEYEYSKKVSLRSIEYLKKQL